MAEIVGRSRPRRLRWEDDGVPVPWLAALVAVYIVAVLNGEFWRETARLMPLTGLSAVLFHAAVLVALCGAHAFVLNLLTLTGVGRVVLAGSVLVAACAAYLAEACDIWMTPESLARLARGEAGGFAGLWHLSALWRVGLMGLVPAVLLCVVPIGRRYFVRELARRTRFALACLVLTAVACAAQYAPLSELVRARPQLLSLLTPYNVVHAGLRLALEPATPAWERAPTGHTDKQ